MEPFGGHLATISKLLEEATRVQAYCQCIGSSDYNSSIAKYSINILIFSKVLGRHSLKVEVRSNAIPRYNNHRAAITDIYNMCSENN